MVDNRSTGSRAGRLEEFQAQVGSAQVILQDKRGTGSSCDVFQAQWHSASVAAKVLKTIKLQVQPGEKEQVEKRVFREWCMLKLVGHHPCIVQCLSASKTVYSEPCLVFELMTSRLQDRFYSLDTDRKFAGYLRSVASGLNFLHQKGILHGALSCKNVLWRDDQVKIADFGLAEVVRMKRNFPYAKYLLEGSEYLPYEAFNQEMQSEYNLAVDVFAFGVLALSCLTRREPSIRISAPRTTMDKLGKASVLPESERRAADLKRLSERHPLRPLILQCWLMTPWSRPSATVVFQYVEKYASLLESQHKK